MKSRRFYIGIALAVVLLGGTALALNGNLLKGSFDAFNAAKDLKITRVNTPANFYVADAAPFAISYTLDKDAYNLFISMSGPDDTKKAQKIFALNASDMSKGNHTITMSPADTKNFFKTAGQYRITIIAYNQDNEISDYTSKTSNVSLGTAKASVSLWDSLSKLKDQPAASTTANTAPNKPEWVTPKGTLTVTANDPFSQKIVLKWNDKGDATPGPEKSAGVFTTNYQWFVVKGELSETSNESQINTAIQNSLVYGAGWHDEAKFKEANMANTSQCIKETTDAQGNMYKLANGAAAKSYVCTTATVPTTVVKTMASGKYTAIIYAGDGELSSFAIQVFTLDSKLVVTSETAGTPAGTTPTPTPAEIGTATSKDLGLKVSVANKVQDEETGDMYVQLQVEKPSTSKITNGDLKIIIEGKDIATKSYNLTIQGDSIIFANNAVPPESVTVNGAKLGAIDKSVTQSDSVFGNLKLPFGMSKSDGKMIKFVVLPPVQVSLAKTKWQSSTLNWTLVHTDSSYQIQQQKGVVDVSIEKPSLIVDQPAAGKTYAWYAYDNKGTYYYLDFNVRNQGGLIPKQLLKKMKDSNATLANAITDDGKSLSVTAAKASLCEYVDSMPLYWGGPYSKNTYGFIPWTTGCKSHDYKKAQGASITELRSIPKGGEFHVKHYSAKNFATPYPDFSPLGSIDWVKLLGQ